MDHAFEILNVTCALILMVAMVFLLVRLFSGPSLYDRALAVNSFGTKIVLFLCIFALIIGRVDGIDIAILYSLMNFIATIAILKFFRYRALDVSLDAMDMPQGTFAGYAPHAEPAPAPIPAAKPKAKPKTRAKAKPVAKKPAAKKTTAKKSTAKKPPAKKPAVKNSKAKKTAPKKPTAKRKPTKQGTL